MPKKKTLEQAVEALSERRTESGRRRNTRMSTDEQTTALTLSNMGYSFNKIGDLMDRSPETISKAVTHARELLQGRSTEYADLHLLGARLAALKGDTRPSEWALEKTGAVKDHREKTDKGKTGVTVQIGIALPGLGLETGPKTLTMPAVAVRTEETDDDDDGPIG